MAKNPIHNAPSPAIPIVPVPVVNKRDPSPPSSSSSSSSSSSTLVLIKEEDKKRLSPLPPPPTLDYKYNGPMAHMSFVFYDNGFPIHPLKSKFDEASERSLRQISLMIERRLSLYTHIHQWLKTRQYAWIDSLSPMERNFLFLVEADDVWDDYISCGVTMATLHSYRKGDNVNILTDHIYLMEYELLRFRMATSLADRYAYFLWKLAKFESTDTAVALRYGSGLVEPDIIPPNTLTCSVFSLFNHKNEIIRKLRLLNIHPLLLGSNAIRRLVRSDTRTTLERYLQAGRIYIMDPDIIFSLVLGIAMSQFGTTLKQMVMPEPQATWLRRTIHFWSSMNVSFVPRVKFDSNVTLLRELAHRFAPKCISDIINNKYKVKIPYRVRLMYIMFMQRSGIQVSEALNLVKNGIQSGWSIQDVPSKWKEFEGNATRYYKKNSIVNNNEIKEVKSYSCSTMYDILIARFQLTEGDHPITIYGCPYRVKAEAVFKGADKETMKSECRRMCIGTSLTDIEDLGKKQGIATSVINESFQRNEMLPNGKQSKAIYHFWNPALRQYRLSTHVTTIGLKLPPPPPSSSSLSSSSSSSTSISISMIK